MKKTPKSRSNRARSADLAPEYRFDYSKAKPNRFAARTQPGSIAVLLDADVARVFESAESVNDVLRALMANMPVPGRSANR